jgi:hypothetical protein
MLHAVYRWKPMFRRNMLQPSSSQVSICYFVNPRIAYEKYSSIVTYMIVTLGGVWIGDRIYCTCVQLVT